MRRMPLRMIVMALRRFPGYSRAKSLYLQCWYGWPCWSLGMLRHGARKRGSILFVPTVPSTGRVAKLLTLLNRYDVHSDPAHDADVSVRYAYGAMSFEDIAPDMVNGRWLNRSKSYLDELHMEIFGYGLSIDPQRYSGRGVIKSEQNATNDGVIVEFPINDARQGVVFQRLVNNIDADGLAEDICIPIFGTFIPHVRLEYRPEAGRFKVRQQIASRVLSPGQVLSASEHAAVLQLCAALGIDWGELDALRDRNDGRLYIVDANEDASVLRRQLPWREYWRTLFTFADALHNHVVVPTRAGSVKWTRPVAPQAELYSSQESGDAS